MELLVKLIDWVKKETWWRPYYKRVTIDETTWGGKCLQCHAGTPENKSIRCSIIDDRDCPCKYNQCLKLK